MGASNADAGGVGRNRYSEPGLTDCVNAAQQAGVVNAAAGGARPWVQMSVNVGSGWPHNALRHNWLMQISCNFRDCKALLVTSLTHVSGAIASAQTLPFTIQIQRHNFRSSLQPISLFPLAGTSLTAPLHSIDLGPLRAVLCTIASAQTFTFYYPDPAAQFPLIAPAYFSVPARWNLAYRSTTLK